MQISMKSNEENVHITTCLSYTFFFTCLILSNTCANGVVQDDQNREYTVCNSSECVKFADFLISSMNKSIKPCDDFYEYACGGWIQKHPPAELYVSTYSEWGKVVKNNINNILNAPSQPDDSRSLKLTRQIYQMCIGPFNSSVAYLNDVLAELGGWPLTMSPDSWNNSIKWQNLSMKLDLYYVKGAFYSIGIPERDPEDLHTRVISLAQPSLLFERKVMLDSSYEFLLESQENFIREVVNVLNHNKTEQESMDFQRQLDQDLTAMIEFSVELAKISLPKDIANRSSIEKLQAIYDSNIENPQDESTKINWLEIMKNVYSMHNIEPSEVILVYGEDYFSQLGNLLKKTSPRTLVNYMLWIFIRQLLQYTSESLRAIANVYNVVEIETNRTLQCVDALNLKHVIYYEYIKKYTSATSKNDIQHYLNDVKSAVERQILNLKWMDNTTKQAILDKLYFIRTQISGPEWYSDTAIDDYYREFTISDKYLVTALRIYELEGKVEANRFRTPINITQKNNFEWNIVTPTDTNAIYNIETNTLCIPAAVMDGFLFSKDRPPAVNYGLIGFIAAHEIFHAFDINGRNYDKDGYAGKWWSDEAIRINDNKIQCFIDQYNNYEVPEAKVWNRTIYINGTITVGENIADSGLSAAYDSYVYHMSTHHEIETRLPNMEEFTANQLFFISTANSHCENFIPDAVDVVVEESHGTGRSRVRGSFSNMIEFAETFNCTPGSPMNPIKKCKLWEE